MSPKQLSFVYCFLLIAVFSAAQRPIVETSTPVIKISSEDLEKLPFSKSFNEFTVQRNFNYMRTKPDNSDDHTANIDLKVDYNRFVVDHVGLGVEMNLSSLKEEFGNSTSKTVDWILYGNLIYGTSFDNFNLYGKLSVGVGKSTDKFNSTITKDDLLGYKFEIGSPVHLFDDGGNYITPFIGYDFLQRKSSNIKFTDNGFQLGFRFENYSPCSAYSCDCHHGRSFSRGAYDQGRSFIGYSSMGDFGFGKTKYKVGNNSTKNDLSGGSLNLEYGYYIIPNLAVGAGLSWDYQKQESTGSDYKSSSLLFTPMITANLPSDNCWNNLFLQGGYGFGSEKNTVGSNDTKYNLTNYCVYLGFNDFFGKHITFTPKIGYEWETSKEENTDLKNKWSGLEFSLGGTLRF
jgi:hypothetical protein